MCVDCWSRYWTIKYGKSSGSRNQETISNGQSTTALCADITKEYLTLIQIQDRCQESVNLRNMRSPTSASIARVLFIIQKYRITEFFLYKLTSKASCLLKELFESSTSSVHHVQNETITSNNLLFVQDISNTVALIRPHTTQTLTNTYSPL